MKDSGMNYNVFIPEEWDAIISRFVIDSIGDVDHAMPDSTESGYPYLFYYFKSDTFFYDVQQYINSNTQGNIGIEALFKTKILVPTVEEQKEIAEYLDLKCSEIDRLIEKKEKFLAELETYKKSIIYEYVTGKKRSSGNVILITFVIVDSFNGHRYNRRKAFLNWKR